MEVDILRTVRKDGKQLENQSVSEKPEQILHLKTMPAGCYVIGCLEHEGTESIISIDSVMFMAICTFKQTNGPVICYGIQDAEGYIRWKAEQDIQIHCYGPYKQACELIGETPKPFTMWYLDNRAGTCDFDLPLQTTQPV